jgi:hypothetical protein
VEIVAANLGHRMLPSPIWTDVYRHPRQKLKAGWHMAVPGQRTPAPGQQDTRSALSEAPQEQHKQ